MLTKDLIISFLKSSWSSNERVRFLSLIKSKLRAVLEPLGGQTVTVGKSSSFMGWVVIVVITYMVVLILMMMVMMVVTVMMVMMVMMGDGGDGDNGDRDDHRRRHPRADRPAHQVASSYKPSHDAQDPNNLGNLGLRRWSVFSSI